MQKGVYTLFIKLDKKKEIEIGALGKHTFEPGIYAYVGSAMNGLVSRIERHKSDNKKVHWHIDYFLEHASIVSTFKMETKKDLECDLNWLIHQLSEETPVVGFGSSDCKCNSHFHQIKNFL